MTEKPLRCRVSFPTGFYPTYFTEHNVERQQKHYFRLIYKRNLPCYHIQRRRPNNEDNPVYQGGGPWPARGMPPPIIILDMQALERSCERNLRAARERVQKRLQEEAKQATRRLEAYQQRQPVEDHDQQSSVEVGVLSGARGYVAGGT